MVGQYDGRAVAAAGRSEHFLARQANAEQLEGDEDGVPTGPAARAAARALRAELLGSNRAASAEPRSTLTGYAPEPPSMHRETPPEAAPHSSAARTRAKPAISKAERRRMKKQDGSGGAAPSPASQAAGTANAAPSSSIKGKRKAAASAVQDEDMFADALPLLRPAPRDPPLGPQPRDPATRQPPAKRAKPAASGRSRPDSTETLDGIFGHREPATFTAADGSVFKDMRLTCRDCGGQFVFAAQTQAALAVRGFAGAKTRCEPCAKYKKCRFGARVEAEGEGRTGVEGARGNGRGAGTRMGRGRAAGGASGPGKGGGKDRGKGGGKRSGKGGSKGGGGTGGARNKERPGTVTF
eukprot:scaffold8264_cov109-Isochrysis_galbana.AAC.2